MIPGKEKKKTKTMEHDNRTATTKRCHIEDYQNENKTVVKIARHSECAMKTMRNTHNEIMLSKTTAENFQVFLCTSGKHILCAKGMNKNCLIPNAT